MRAAVYHGVGDVRLEDVEEPALGAGQVLLQVAYNGLCGTDLHEIFDVQQAVPARPHPLTGVQAPVILGHEIGGTVIAVGDGVDDVEPGALVAVEPLMVCGTCYSCRAGDVNLCERLAFHGLSTGGGGLAERTVVPRAMVHVVPEGLTATEATMAEPLAVAWHAVARAGMQTGRTAAVLGGGPIGIAIYLTLRMKGIDAIVVEPSSTRRAVVAALGAVTVDPAEGPVGEALRERTEGRGVDRCFETSAVVASLEAALDGTARHGVVMLLASPRAPLPPVLGRALAKELEVRTSLAYCGEFPAVLAALASGAYPLDGWVATRPLSALPAVLDELRAGTLLKVLIDPSA